MQEFLIELPMSDNADLINSLSICQIADIFGIDYFSLDIRGSCSETGMNINTADIFRVDYFSLDIESPELRQG